MAFKFNYLKTFTQDFLLGKILSLIVSWLEMVILSLCRPSKKLFSLFGMVLKIKPNYSMLSTVRLLNLYTLIQEVDRLKVPGDVVECGVWNGGAAAMIGRGHQDSTTEKPRTIWLFDSFEGLPPPSNKDCKSEVEHYFAGLCKGEISNVKTIFSKLDVRMDNVKIIKGWLNDTLKPQDIKQVALLHIDTDWYYSVKTPLDHLYDKVTPGGFIIVDDYWFHQGCRAAVSDFLKERDLEGIIKVNKVDRSAMYFQKPL